MLTYLVIVPTTADGYGHESVNGEVGFHPFLDGTSSVHLDGRSFVSRE